MCDIIKDIINNCKHNNLYDKYKSILDDFKYCDYSKDWVNAPSCYGDTYKWTIEYSIGEYKFVYYHILASEIDSSKFTIEHHVEDQMLHDRDDHLGLVSSKNDDENDNEEDVDEEKGEILYTYSYMQKLALRMNLKNFKTQEYPLNTNLLNKFKEKYSLNDENLYFLFNLINSFAFGQCIGLIHIENKYKVELIYLDELINVIPPYEDGEEHDEEHEYEEDDDDDDEIDYELNNLIGAILALRN